PGRTVERGKTLGTMETGKWVGPLKSPITGTIVENNPVLRRKASLVNEESYGGGWLSVLEPTNLEEDLKNLMTEIDIPWLEKEIVKYVKK
ncbi:glycine cleavage system protein H, partial [Candidatus Bathyarchaeota archaeon]|nr:glycine cleavage system protein H [Candidatus Bathyarchaeota archaeon]